MKSTALWIWLGFGLAACGNPVSESSRELEAEPAFEPFAAAEWSTIADPLNPNSVLLLGSSAPGICERFRNNQRLAHEEVITLELAHGEDVEGGRPDAFPLTPGTHSYIAHTETSSGPRVGRWSIGSWVTRDDNCERTQTLEEATAAVGIGGVTLTAVNLQPDGGLVGDFSAAFGSTGTPRFEATFRASYCAVDFETRPTERTCLRGEVGVQ